MKTVKTQPAKLDTKTTDQLYRSSKIVTRLAKRPIKRLIAFPVKSSPPNMMIKKIATGKNSPATIFGRQGQLARTSTGIPPAIVTTRITANPIHHPARSPRKKSFPKGICALYIDSFSCSFSTSAMELSSCVMTNF
jgi:hypothetical protein